MPSANGNKKPDPPPKGSNKSPEHVAHWQQALRATFRAIWGTDMHMDTQEERQKAIDAITRMKIEAESLRDIGKEARAEPIEDIEEALLHIAKDFGR